MLRLHCPMINSIMYAHAVKTLCMFGLLAALLLENIFRQLSQEAARVSQSATVSRVVEEVISLADRDQLTVLLEQFSTDWETVCCDQFASHVTQALVKRCGHFLRKTLLSYCLNGHIFIQGAKNSNWVNLNVIKPVQ